MFIEAKTYQNKEITWEIRCPTINDAEELSLLRLKIDGETENLDREPGEAYLSPYDFVQMIQDDLSEERSLFLVAVVNHKIIGYTRCIGNPLTRFRHKAEFGIVIEKAYWGYGIGNTMLENVLKWSDQVGIKKVTLQVVHSNEHAINLYKKYGFKEEGLLMNDRLHKDGNYYHTLLMGRLTENSE